MKATHLSRRRARRISGSIALGLGVASLAIAQTPPPTAGSGDLEEIVVRGVRKSVEKAQEVKREALQVTDSVVAEDIGKLPDNSVAEALSRITGVQINRIRADASATLIRGLPNVVTTLNGREIFTTRERGIALADIPADLLQRVSVYKSNSPEHLAGGIAGTIDVALRRPFDFDGFAGAVSARGVYSDQAESTSPVGSALISNRWDTDGGSFGALFAVSYQDIDFLEQNTFNGTYDEADNPSNPGQTILRPFVIGAIDTLGDHARTSANASFQWAPNDNAELHFDAFYVKYDEDFALNFWIPLPGIPDTALAATLKPDSNVAQTWRSHDIFTLTSNQAFKRESHTEQYAFGGKFKIGDNTELRSELAWTKSTANNRGVILDTGFIAPRMDVDFSVGGASSALITNADGSPFDVTDSSHYWLEQIFDQRDDQNGDELSLTADVNHAVEGLFSSLDGGIQLSKRTAESNAANGGGVNRFAFGPHQVFVDQVEALTGVAGIQDKSPKGMLDGDRDIATDQWFIANREFLLDHTDVLRGLFDIPSTDPPPNDVANFFDDEEKTTAFYAQAKFDTQLGSLPFDGVFGARYVRTEATLHGTEKSTDASTGAEVLTPISIDKTDSDILPSINARLKLQEDLHLRLALFKTITRPNFRDLNPQRVLTQPGPTLPGQGFGGNPNLDNVEAKSADLSLEWYFAPGSLLSGTLFYRDIKGYIQSFVSVETVGGIDFDVTRPQSSGSGDMKGAEFAYTQFFDKLPGVWSGFGVQLNYTMIDAKADTSAGVDQDLTNVSDSSYNAILMYENKIVSGRLAYNWRSDYVESYNQGGAQPTAVRVKPISTLDFSLGFNVNDHITIAFDAVNLLDRPLFNYFGGGSASSEDARLYNRDVRSNDTRYSLGVRLRL